MPSARRTFLQQASVGAAAFLTLPAAVSAQSIDTPANVGASEMSRTSFAAAVTDWETQQAESWDTSWTKRVTGKHKAMFDVPEIEGGVGVSRAAFWGRQYMDVLKVTPADLSTVIVIRHAAIFLLMNQEYWTTYEVGKARKLKNERGKVQLFNPVLAAPGDARAANNTMLLDRQLANGAIVLGCNLAFRSVVSLIEKKDKIPNAAAREKAKGMIVPGAIMQPSGIFANVMAEEAGCVFVQAV
jgi:Na+-transporting NADH:ubiquinone oxidoreductase subunit NqrB